MQRLQLRLCLRSCRMQDFFVLFMLDMPVFRLISFISAAVPAAYMIYLFPPFPDMITDIITLNTITKKITQIDTVVDM